MESMPPISPLPFLNMRSAWAAMSMAMLLLLMPALAPHGFAAERAVPPRAMPPMRGAAIDADREAGHPAQQLAAWIAITGDNAGSPFIIIDKKRASVLVFAPDARLRARSAVLLGLARGDDSVPGIGTRPMAQILPAERTTPAGRFVGELGVNTQGEDVIWVDYEAAVSMHRVRKGNPVERRAERLATPTIDDNRISYGCINVPVDFYETFIQPIFAQRKAIVYVLPEIKSVNEVFGILKASTMESDASSASGNVQTGIGVRH